VAREIALYTLEGVTGARATVHPFWTADKIGLSLTRFHRADCRDVVMVIHGLSTSSDMFIMPEHYNLVQYLLDHGFTDVWTLDCRMSNRHVYNLVPHDWTLDDVALHDYPAALAALRAVAGDVRVHVICHCLGSISFVMSLAAGLTPEVTSVISNSVAFTPRVPRWSRFKLRFAMPLMRVLVGQPYINPNWAADPWMSRGKLLARLVSLVHRECDVPACHLLSLMWGSGRPALYNHANLDERTHRRGGDLFGGVGLHYDEHVLRMVEAGRAVKLDRGNPAHRALPDDYWERAPAIATPILFVTGSDNKVFADSNVVCHEQLNRLAPGRHQLQVFPRYGHQDVFMGKTNHLDTFPRFLAFLREHAA
jgi:cholesterol oxidase